MTAWRLGLAALFGLVLIPAQALHAQAPAERAKAVSFDIPAGDLTNALVLFVKQSGTASIDAPNMRLSSTTTGVSGVLPPREALQRLLSGTGLSFLEEEAGKFVVLPSTDVRVPGARCVRVGPGDCRELVDQTQAMPFNIPAGTLRDALVAFRKQSGALSTMSVDIPVSRRTGGVSGVLPPREALARLLSGTDLTFLEDGLGTYTFLWSRDVRVPGGRCEWEKSAPICREVVPGESAVAQTQADRATAVSFNIPGGSVLNALGAFFNQSGARGHVPLGIDIVRICPSPAAGSKRKRDCTIGFLKTAGVTGTMTPREALERLLSGTGWTFRQDETGTYHFQGPE